MPVILQVKQYSVRDCCRFFCPLCRIVSSVDVLQSHVSPSSYSQWPPQCNQVWYKKSFASPRGALVTPVFLVFWSFIARAKLSHFHLFGWFTFIFVVLVSILSHIELLLFLSQWRKSHVLLLRGSHNPRVYPFYFTCSKNTKPGAGPRFNPKSKVSLMRRSAIENGWIDGCF